MPWDTSSVPCGGGGGVRFLLVQHKRKWQLVNSLVLFTSHPAPFLVLSCLSLSALPVPTPGLQKKRALWCRQLLTAFYLCTPFSWIKNNSFPPLVFMYPQDLYLNWSKAQAWLRLTQGGEASLQVRKARVEDVVPYPLHTGQAGNKQQTCCEVGGSCATSLFPAAEWVPAICSCYLQSQESCAQSPPRWGPGLRLHAQPWSF